MVESSLYTALNALVGGRMFPDEAPSGTATPYIVYQQVGGKPVNLLGPESSDKKNARIQIAVWCETRLEASGIIRTIEDTIVHAPLLGEVLSMPIATIDSVTNLRGATQDFSFWS